jgi:hypothetical protein
MVQQGGFCDEDVGDVVLLVGLVHDFAPTFPADGGIEDFFLKDSMRFSAARALFRPCKNQGGEMRA